MIQREVIIPHFESLLSTNLAVPNGENEIIEMCSFVEAVRKNKCYSNTENDYSKMLLEYKRLRRRTSKSALLKLECLNMLLEANGCYNEYANKRAVACKIGKLKSVLDEVAQSILYQAQSSIYYNVSDETVEWMVNNALWKAIIEGAINEKQLRKAVVFVKCLNGNESLSGNSIDRFFYDCVKYDDKQLLYYLPIIKGAYGDFERVRDVVMSAHLQQLRTIKESRKDMKGYKQTIFCTPVWIDTRPSSSLIKKVW